MRDFFKSIAESVGASKINSSRLWALLALLALIASNAVFQLQLGPEDIAAATISVLTYMGLNTARPSILTDVVVGGAKALTEIAESKLPGLDDSPADQGNGLPRVFPGSPQ